MINRIQATFQARFSPSPSLFKAPGRVNLIGEHTDYNKGFVLPAAIDKAIYFAIAPNGQTSCRLYAMDLHESFEFPLADFAPLTSGWANYLMGVVDQLQASGHLIQGFDCVFGGDIPVGAGMSSSAALACGLTFGLNNLFDLGLERMQMARLAQKAEHTYAGVMCGIMDQFACMFGKQNQVVRLDCRSMDVEYYPFDMSDYLIALCDTGVSHSLASSEYNIRRQQCEAGVAVVKRRHPQVGSLRDVSISMLKSSKHEMDPLVYQRCGYVIAENQRLKNACDYLQQGDLPSFGQQMYASHEGLSKVYEVSCKELDLLVEFTHSNEDVLGARMMGGGFGGCTINLVKADKVEAFCSTMKVQYEAATNRELNIYLTKIEEGVRILNGE